MRENLSARMNTIAVDNEWTGTQYRTALDWADEVASIEIKLEVMKRGWNQALVALDEFRQEVQELYMDYDPIVLNKRILELKIAMIADLKKE